MSEILIKDITFFGNACTLACDANCGKAWGINHRPRIYLHPDGEDADPDDYAFLADSEVGVAPVDPGTYEGGHAKPEIPEARLNKWCARECERSTIVDRGDVDIKFKDFSRRVYNRHARQQEAERVHEFPS